MGPIEIVVSKIKAIADAIRAKTGTTAPLTLDEIAESIEYLESDGALATTYILVDEDGYEIPATLVEEEVELTATANDIRLGTTAVTDDGVIEGEKEIPSYNTEEGYKLVPAGSSFSLSLPLLDMYDFTKLQIIVCAFSGSVSGSVAADRVVINDGVYAVNSSELISTVTKNDSNKTIELGIMNSGSAIYLMRYITYKEIY